MSIEIPSHQVSEKDEGILNLFRANSKEFSRGIFASLKTVRFGGPGLGEGLLATAAHTIADERESFPNNPDVQGRDFEVGVVIGEWIKLKNLEAEMEANPAFKQAVLEAQGLIELPS